MTPPSFPHSSMDTEEVQRFNQLSKQWWDESGPFKPLHQLNPYRIQYIRDCLAAHFQRDRHKTSLFSDLSILDIGCGGGLVAEPLTRLGATVMGIDASWQAINVATDHARMMELPITYACTTAEDLLAQNKTFDIVLALEIVEHVTDVASFLKTCTRLIAPHGAFIVSTINRTWKAYALAIVGAEYIMRYLPKGTHDWNKFLRPSELAAFLRPLGFSFADLRGLTYNLLKNQWSLSNDLDVNYLGYARRLD